MFEPILTYFGYQEPGPISSVIRDFLSILGLGLVGIIAFFWKATIAAFKSRFTSELRKYRGEYFGYRYNRHSLVRPKIRIRRAFSGKFVLEWAAPGHKPEVMDLVKSGTMLVATRNSPEYYALIAIFESAMENPGHLAGLYLFRAGYNGLPTSGSFFMSRYDLPDEAVENFLPAHSISVDTSTVADWQRAASNHAKAFPVAIKKRRYDRVLTLLGR